MSANPPRGELAGQRVIVTRPFHQAAELREMLEAHGATVLLIPALEMQPPANPGPLDEALRESGRYQWAIFTSANTVERVAARAAELALPPLQRLLANAQICAIGPATQAALESLGCRVALLPERYVAESVAAAFSAVPLAGVRVLLPRAEVARDVVPAALRERGALVDVVDAYRSVIPAGSIAAIREMLDREETVDWVTFTSGSTVTNFLAMGGQPLLKGARIASIGPITSEAAAKHCLQVDAEAQPHTASGLVAALLQYGPGLRTHSED